MSKTTIANGEKSAIKQELDILLINPPNLYTQKESIWVEVDSNFPPLGLADIAGYLREKEYKIEILDSNLNCPSVEMFHQFFIKNYVSRFSSIKIIGITSATVQIKKAYLIAKITKKYFPKSLIVFGGVHTTFVTEEVIKNKYVDIAVIGEGELTLEEIISDKSLDQISGIAYKKYSGDDYEIIYTDSRTRIKDLDSLPMPAYDLLQIERYKPAIGSYKRLPAMSMMTSRGCPGKCTFCEKTLGNRLVYKSAETIFKEIKYLIKNYGIKQIQFYDDTFTTHKNNVIDLCKKILSEKVDITWTCFSRVDFINFKMLKYMKNAGCHQIMYGVETIDETVLKNINKKINVSQIIKAVKWTKKVGIECRLAFMVGNPGDTKENIMKNISFVNLLNPDYLIVNITTPYPGTEMFKWAKEKNLILTYNWDDYDLSKPIMKLENLNENEIKDLYQLMFRKFYFRPRYILKRIFSIKSVGDIKILLEGFNSITSFFRKRLSKKIQG
ncbi:MAG: B12-binding domain-containing radical SAM protein [Promethearchaeota archaeon]